MRRTLAAILITLGGCASLPSPTGERPELPAPTSSTRAVTAAATPVTRTPPFNPPASSPTASPTTFTFDVENHASIGVVVSVASDTAATLPGFEPGQRGTIVITLQNPENGISVEIQGMGCRLLSSAMYPTPRSFTRLVEDGPEPGTVNLSTRTRASSMPVPLPSNSLIGCGG